MERQVQGSQPRAAGGPQTTIAALFEEAVDAEHALLALRKADQNANRVSLLLRRREDDQSATDGAVDVARDIVAAALGAVAQWLIGLAELIVSDRERYLVAGPMGAALTDSRRGDELRPGEDEDSAVVATELNADRLQRVLTEFGFSPKVATYIEHRLAAGATLIAMTTADRADLERVERLFSDHGAVFINQAETREEVLEATAALLARPAAMANGGEVSVADAVARLRPVASHDARADLEAVRGRAVQCATGEDAGKVVHVLVEEVDRVESGAGDQGAVGVEPRYVVVGFGGVLGIGRHQVAVPIQIVDLGADPVQVQHDRDALSRAPDYDAEVPLGRREEERIYRYFDIVPYWAADARSIPAQSGGTLHASGSERD